MTTLAEDYLDGNNGSSEDYRRMLSKGQRIGQAFVNALSEYDYNRLSGTLDDPFHADGSPFEIQAAVYKAIEFLMDDNSPHFVYYLNEDGSTHHRTACGCSEKQSHYSDKVLVNG